ncbi:50S ribosomal protein L35 [Patescibacteria group bacterium]|nr:50S ribosomal protein L35 [Patescibacteria group bacterium]MCL5091879.1 50S ribosomal protein L35 [Patescibacteria group bacterium]
MAKSKQKTRKAALKRFKLTKTGKVLHRSQRLRHLRGHKSKSQIRRLKRMKTVSGTMRRKIKRMLGKG